MKVSKDIIILKFLVIGSIITEGEDLIDNIFSRNQFKARELFNNGKEIFCVSREVYRKQWQMNY